MLMMKSMLMSMTAGFASFLRFLEYSIFPALYIIECSVFVMLYIFQENLSRLLINRTAAGFVSFLRFVG